MYTQCPHCQTCFRIAEAHLKAAKGKVRCGSCKEVFDATNHLYNTMPDAKAGKKASLTKTKPAPPPAPAPAAKPKPAKPPLPGISSAFGDEEHEHIDLSAPAQDIKPEPPVKPLSIPERENAPDQSAFMESLVGRYNNLDDMGSINIPGESPMTDSFIRYVDGDDIDPGKISTTDKAADSEAPGIDLSTDNQAETDEAIANIKAQLSEFDLELGNDKEAEPTPKKSKPAASKPSQSKPEPTAPYEDAMAPDLPANTVERNAIENMFDDIDAQVDSPMMKDDPETLNANINALLDDAMAMDNKPHENKEQEKKEPEETRPADDPVFGLDENNDFINDSLQNADETLAQFEAELEDMKLEPQIDENVSVFDIDHADPPARSADEEAVDFEQFDLEDTPKATDELASAEDKSEPEDMFSEDLADNISTRLTTEAETSLPQDKDQDLLEDFLMDTESSSDSELGKDSDKVVENIFLDNLKQEAPESIEPMESIEPVAPAKEIKVKETKSSKTKSDDLKSIDESDEEELPSIEHDIPKALRSSFENFEVPSRPMWLTVSMAAGIFALVVSLLSQVIIFRSYQLADSFPGMSPMLGNLCEMVSCRYSGEIDVEKIQLINRNVSTHPSQKNALLISTAFVNKADFSQPYPTIAIKLSDLSGETVATRYFRPEEYLENLYNKFLLMESGTPVHITLAVLDPGNDAVNFEFSFL